MKKNLFLLFFVLVSALFLSACYTVPVTDRSQFNVLSSSEEDAMGEQYYNDFLKKEKISNNKQYSNAVDRIISGITPHSQAQMNWKVSTIKKNEANAFCVPGGKIVVYDGLSNYTANEAELATVVAHEMAHAVARHSGEAQSQNMVVAIGGLALDIAGFGEWVPLYNIGSQVGFALPFSRKQEYEADFIGCVFMAKAGYDPRASITFWQKLKEDDNAVAEFFSTHPGGQDRIDELNKNMPIFMDYYQAAKIKQGLGESFSNQSPSPTIAAQSLKTPTANVKSMRTNTTQISAPVAIQRVSKPRVEIPSKPTKVTSQKEKQQRVEKVKKTSNRKNRK